MKLSEIEDPMIEHSARCQIATDKNLLPQTSQHFSNLLLYSLLGPNFASSAS